MTTIFENDIVKVLRTGRDYDFIAVIEGKTDKDIEIIFTDEVLQDESISIEADEWIGLLADEEGWYKLQAIEAEEFRVYVKPDYRDFEFWNKDKLWELRQQIVLSSLFGHHYENSFGIPSAVCCSFFDSFVEWCWILESEDENGGLTEWKDILDKYDNADELWDYFCGMEYPFGE